MTRFSATIIALVCLFTLSLARTSPENDDVTSQVSLPLSESSAALRLPGEHPNADADVNTAVETSVPLTKITKITFRPSNRRFRVRSKKPCRNHFRFYPAVRENEEIPYGNDMIVSSGENSDFQDPVLHGEGRRVPGRWVRLHHHPHRHRDEDSDSDDDADEDRMKKMAFKRYDFDRFDREKRPKVLKKMRKHFQLQNEMEEAKKEGGFMKRLRKFFDHYF